MAMTSALQADGAGSIPATRSRVWRSLASARARGARGRVFESPHSDVKKRISRRQVKRRAEKLKNFGRIDCPRCSSVVPCAGCKLGNENNPGQR